MATPVSFNQFIADLHNGVHNFSAHTFKAMLSNELPLAADTVKADIAEIAAGNGYTAGGVTVPITGSAQVGGVYTAAVDDTADVTITPTGGNIGPFQYIVVYNDSVAGKPLVQWYALPSAITLSATEPVTPFTFDFGTSIRTAAYA